jgi:hypothetical protein
VDDQFGYDRQSGRSSRHQRGDPRESMFLHARARLGEVIPGSPLRVRNISSGGLMADCQAPLATGDPIEIELRNIGWVVGRVTWARAGRIGVAFADRIDPQLARSPVGAGGDSGLLRTGLQPNRRPALKVE